MLNKHKVLLSTFFVVAVIAVLIFSLVALPKNFSGYSYSEPTTPIPDTMTFTFTPTSTNTFTFTPTRTSTSTPTSTNTFTFTPTRTSTSTPTSTKTFTVAPPICTPTPTPLSTIALPVGGLVTPSPYVSGLPTRTGPEVFLAGFITYVLLLLLGIFLEVLMILKIRGFAPLERFSTPVFLVLLLIGVTGLAMGATLVKFALFLTYLTVYAARKIEDKILSGNK